MNKNPNVDELKYSDFYKKLVELRAYKENNYGGFISTYNGYKQLKISNGKSIGSIKNLKKRCLTIGLSLAIGAGLITYGENAYHKKYYDANGNVKKLVLNQYTYGYETPFNACYDNIIENGESIRKYKTSNIYFLIDEETKEISTYILINGKDYGNKVIGEELYDFDSEELVMFKKNSMGY